MTTMQPNLPRSLKRFFLEYLPQQRNCSPHTVRSYRDALRLFLHYLRENKQVAPDDLALKDLSAETILDFLNDLQASRHNSVDTRNARLAALRCFAKYLLWVEPTLAGDLQRVLAIPVKRSTRPVLDFLTREEIDAVLDAPDETTWSGKRDRALFAVIYNTGARVSEAVGAKVSDVTLTPGGALRLHGKGRKDRTVPLTKQISKSLGTWIAGNHLREEQVLFTNARGAPLTRSGVEKRLREAVKKAGEKCPSLKTKRISPHTLRHTTAMHLLQKGADIATIALWLGHESTETTHAYMTTDLEMKEKALQALQPASGGGFRFRPKAALLTFLESL